MDTHPDQWTQASHVAVTFLYVFKIFSVNVKVIKRLVCSSPEISLHQRVYYLYLSTYFWSFESWGNPSGVLLPFMICVPRALQTERAMAPHSSVLAWKIPGTGELSGLPSMGSHRVGHNEAT